MPVKQNVKISFLIDSDMEIDIKCIPELIKLFDSSKSCVVIGSRWKKQKDNKKNINTYANIFINHLFNFLYKTTINDVLCCVKVIDKNLFKSLDLTSNRFTIEIEIMSKLAIKRIRLIEFDVDYRRRNYNEGKKLRASDGLSIIWEMLKLKIISKRIMPRPQINFNRSIFLTFNQLDCIHLKLKLINFLF